MRKKRCFDFSKKPGLRSKNLIISTNSPVKKVNFPEQNIKAPGTWWCHCLFCVKHLLVPFGKAGLCRLCRIIREWGSGNLRWFTSYFPPVEKLIYSYHPRIIASLSIFMLYISGVFFSKWWMLNSSEWLQRFFCFMEVKLEPHAISARLKKKLKQTFMIFMTFWLHVGSEGVLNVQLYRYKSWVIYVYS